MTLNRTASMKFAFIVLIAIGFFWRAELVFHRPDPKFHENQ